MIKHLPEQAVLPQIACGRQQNAPAQSPLIPAPDFYTALLHKDTD